MYKLIELIFANFKNLNFDLKKTNNEIVRPSICPIINPLF